jgi:Uma2 family endonuclease
MSAAGRLKPLDWEAYLVGEERAERKHEYVNGFVYAMAGGRIQHHRLASNVLAALSRRLGSGRCEAFNSDLKVQIRSEKGIRFYYPDCTVVCDADDPDAVFVDRPIVVVEVMSRSTRRIDEGEKREGYLSLPSLAAYVMVDSERVGVAVWRRQGNDFKSEAFLDLNASVPLPEINVELPMAEIYSNVTWPAEPPEKEE